jgi:hypothetical protein
MTVCLKFRSFASLFIFIIATDLNLKNAKYG